MSILGKFLGLTAKGKVLKTPSYMKSWRVTKDMMVKRMDKRKKLIKGFKNPKFLAKAKLKDYDTVL